MNDPSALPAQKDEMRDGITIVHHALHRVVHVAVIDMTVEERTAWRLINPEVKKKFTNELALFGSALHFTGTRLQLVAPEGVFSGIGPAENCQEILKDLEVMVDAYRR